MSSKDLYERSRRVTPGGVSSPVRAFLPYPPFISRAEGSRIFDAEGESYTDLCMAYGPIIAGHACPEVIKAISNQLTNGTLFGAPSEPELELIEEIIRLVPSAEMVRLASTGTEATMHAIRAARGFTGRDGIVRMNGGYHGAHDAVLASRLSGYRCIPSSAGVPNSAVQNTFITEYNDEESLTEILEKESPACVIMEPVLGNVGVVPPKKGYLESVRKITRENDVVLIFDEVITGFRLSPGGAQEFYGVVPDMTTCAKIMGGGLSGSAFMGRREIMENIAPSGRVFAAGTYSGNPVSAVAGLAQIKHMASGNRYRDLNRTSDAFGKYISDALEDSGAAACLNRVGSMMCVYFGMERVSDGREAMETDRDSFDTVFRQMLERRTYMAPSALEDWFISSAHTNEDLAAVAESFASSLEALK